MEEVEEEDGEMIRTAVEEWMEWRWVVVWWI